MQALSIEAKSAYDRTRFAWLAADTVLETTDTQALSRQARIAIARNAASTATARRGIAISGAAGMGKSTSALLLGKRHDRSERKRLGREDDRQFAPVVYTVVPPATTPKMLMQAFAQWLGLPVLQRATAPMLAEQVVAILRTLGTSLVIVDEVHNLKTNRQAGAEAASTLKQFADRLDATFLYAGIDLPTTDLFAGEMGRQIKARMILHEMTPYSIGTKASRESWADLVLGVENLLPLAAHIPESLVEESHYLWDRTGGSIGALRGLLSDAAIGAILDGTEKIDRHRLEATATDYAAQEHHRSHSKSGASKSKKHGLRMAQ
ncbi:ATP-binding protein [Arthrobacter sp. MMS18-M83]|uniref:ATP-binding protein n=1 Tax=Arthrobacter sp. MMS18-M83 TaxID=2996261 RepID=UPI00227B55E2|nr:ATP-binding protein [Arthrobacter sp. MMS18-M83]WAH96282.1 ATP-binding protein [Arthrobacter sp. MMS18-M83]